MLLVLLGAILVAQPILDRTGTTRRPICQRFGKKRLAIDVLMPYNFLLGI